MRVRGRRLLLTGLAAVLLAGCAEPVTGLRTDLGLSFLTFQFDRVAVGGVAFSGETDPGREARYATLLGTRLAQKRERLTVVSADYVRGKVGAQAYRELLAEYRRDGALGKARLAELREKIGVARYVVFARIDGDESYDIRLSRAETEKNGKPIPDRERVTRRTNRSVVVSLRVYDLEKGRGVWSGSIAREGRSEVEYVKHVNEGLVTLVEHGAAPPENEVLIPEPGAPRPEVEGLIGDAFTIFADSLPKS